MTPADKARELLAPWDGRCLRCGWTLAASSQDGCTADLCRYIGRDREQRVTVPPDLIRDLLADVERLERERDGLREALNTLHAWADGFENPRTGMGAGLHAEMYPMLHPGGRRYLLEITRAALTKDPANGT